VYGAQTSSVGQVTPALHASMPTHGFGMTTCGVPLGVCMRRQL
jgi:hypothetical protein